MAAEMSSSTSKSKRSRGKISGATDCDRAESGAKVEEKKKEEDEDNERLLEVQGWVH